MIKTIPCCDICNEPLPIIITHTPLGKVRSVISAKTKVINTEKAFPLLCEKCALKIDNALLNFKLEIQRRENNDKTE